MRYLKKDDADYAMSAMNDKEFDGNVLTVNFAENKKKPFVPRDGGGYQGRDRYDDRRRDRYDDRGRAKYDDRGRDRYDDRGSGVDKDRSRDRRDRSRSR